MVTSIFEKIIYGLKVSNDNIIVLNDKLDKILKVLVYEPKPDSPIIPDNIEPNDF